MEIGVNLPWFGGYYGHDLGPNQAYPDWPVWYDGGKVGELLEFVRSFGIRLVRVWLFEEGEGITAESHLDELFLRNLSDLVERIRLAEIQVYWTLLDAGGARAKHDLFTARILTEPAVTQQFALHALATVAPMLKDVAWAIDLCNEPEAIVKGRTGNWTRTGWKWSDLRPSLAILRESVASLLPGIRVSIGSGYHNHSNLTEGVYDRLNLNLDFFDFHLYTPVGQALACPTRTEISATPVVLGEIGCVIPEEDRGSEQTWTASQTNLAAHVEAIRDLGFEAAFPWYLNDPQAADATGLVFRGQTGAVLRAMAT